MEDGGVYYHGKLYERAREGYIRSLRTQTATQPPEHFAALAALRAVAAGPPEEQLKQTVSLYCGRMFPVKYWESVLLPRRIRRYSGAMLDKLLAEGDYFWRMGRRREISAFAGMRTLTGTRRCQRARRAWRATNFSCTGNWRAGEPAS